MTKLIGTIVIVWFAILCVASGLINLNGVGRALFVLLNGFQQVGEEVVRDAETQRVPLP